ncbi:MAG: winged helix-turn-helix transcriptional regulator [Deltaproteobacteria bacterium]|jgi:DNA-binding MarR family transcriptional regulator|nr:winged helix-turn-helix transcriptional regulator [Deltaproteobacteria bacterium]
MNNSLQDQLFKPSDRMRDLQLLGEIEQNPKVSQRELSHKFGIALGVTNACIKRMARRGLIRLKGFPPRRIAYYLTPKGFAEKSKLMVHFFFYNIQHYAEMKKVISKRLLEMQEDGVKRVAFCGVSDEMEVAYITLQGSDMKLVGITDEDGDKQGKKFLGHKVLNLQEMKGLNPDAILITSMQEQTSYIKSLAKQKGLDSTKVFRI